MAEIHIDNVSKVFADGTVAVQALDITVAHGEFLSLLGPSGCGKSTLLRMIAGLEDVTEGEISFDGRRVDNLPPGKRNVSMVFQNYALYPHLSVRDNLAYPLKKRGMARAERYERATAVANVLRMEQLLDRRPRQLSGGQQQRVALGRAMIREPSVFLLDEPLSNLDAQLRVSMRSELIRLHRSITQTMVYVTHDQFEAMTMSDRTAVLDKGKMQQIGTPAEIYRRPANRFVAGFVGMPAMNFMPVDLKIEAGRRMIRNALVELSGARLDSLQTQAQSIELGVRAEDVSIVPGAPNAVVNLVEMTGHENLVVVESGDCEVTLRTPPDQAYRVGDQVRVVLNPERMHFFETAGGSRIAGWNQS
jgi:multiple sugar transport system ATP-binding protein